MEDKFDFICIQLFVLPKQNSTVVNVLRQWSQRSGGSLSIKTGLAKNITAIFMNSLKFALYVQ